MWGKAAKFCQPKLRKICLERDTFFGILFLKNVNKFWDTTEAFIMEKKK